MGTISLSLPSDGQTIDSSDVNTPFNTIANEINGNLDNSNIKAGAAIDRSKIAGFTDGWENLGYAPNTITNNGNGSYDVVFSSVDLTSATSVGQRLKLPRIVTAPTQCADLEASSSQYFSKSSPSGMTFTDDFVVSAWIKLESYPSTFYAIASRYNGTNGWSFDINSSGQIRLIGLNGGSGNNSYVQSYQSVPLGKWVHVAAQLDMSTFTATTTTSYIMFDGKDVPASVARAGTNPTALIQAGDLNIGAQNSLLFFDGKLAQVAIYSAKVTQATILAAMNQTLAGSETSLVSAYTFNNSINDLSANANNLTANGSAVATNADTPFTNSVTGTNVTAGTTNYGIIMAQSFSTNTTYTVQVPEGETLPTSGGIGTVYYSAQKTPYGFPSEANKWTISADLGVTIPTSGTSSATVYNPGGFALIVPVGKWHLRSRIQTQLLPTSNLADWVFGLSTSSSNFVVPRWFTRVYTYQGVGTFCINSNTFVDTYDSSSAATTIYALVRSQVAITGMDIRGDSTGSYGMSFIEIINAYL